MCSLKWKGVFLCYFLYKKYLYLKKNNMNIFVNIYNSSFMILNEFVGVYFKVYNGLKFLNVFVMENKVGYKFGEFVYMCKLSKCIYMKSNMKKKNIKKKKNVS